MRPHPPPATSVLELVPDPERGTIVPPETAEDDDDEGGPEGAALLVAGAYGCGCASTVVWLVVLGALWVLL